MLLLILVSFVQICQIFPIYIKLHVVFLWIPDIFLVQLNFPYYWIFFFFQQAISLGIHEVRCHWWLQASVQSLSSESAQLLIHILIIYPICTPQFSPRTSNLHPIGTEVKYVSLAPNWWLQSNELLIRYRNEKKAIFFIFIDEIRVQFSFD